MKHTLFIFSFLCAFNFQNCYSQHTDKFLKLTKNIVASDSVLQENHYEDNSIKNTGFLLQYKRPEFFYHIKSGTHKAFYKDGQIKSIQEYDRYGNILKATFYNPDGTTWWKSKTLSIDSSLENPNDFFSSNHIVIEKWLYEYERKNGKMYLKTEGKVSNNKKVGKWNVYNEVGKLISIEENKS